MPARRDDPALRSPPKDHHHTAIDPIPEPTTTQPWNELFDELKARYPKVRERILAALAALMQNPDIDAEPVAARPTDKGQGCRQGAPWAPLHGGLKPTWTSRR